MMTAREEAKGYSVGEIYKHRHRLTFISKVDSIHIYYGYCSRCQFRL